MIRAFQHEVKKKKENGRSLVPRRARLRGAIRVVTCHIWVAPSRDRKWREMTIERGSNRSREFKKFLLLLLITISSLLACFPPPSGGTSFIRCAGRVRHIAEAAASVRSRGHWSKVVVWANSHERTILVREGERTREKEEGGGWAAAEKDAGEKRSRRTK